MTAWYRRGVAAVNTVVTQRPKTVIIVFLLITGLFATGLAEVRFDADIEGFMEDVPEQEALEQVHDEFEPPFEEDEAVIQLFHEDTNVLDRTGVVKLLTVEERLERHDEITIQETTSVAAAIAQAIDPEAQTPEEQVRAVEGATSQEVREAARLVLAEEPGLQTLLSDDLSLTDPSASATLALIETSEPADFEEERRTLERIETIASDVGDFTTFSGAMLDYEFELAMEDSLTLTIPLVAVLILGFLIVAYRDPIDLTLGLFSLVMAVLWTFGFMGLVDIPFTILMVAVPPLLLAVGVDFGIHAVNRYREERLFGYGIRDGMFHANRQLVVAFFIVTGTTAIGFGANVTSDLVQIQEFGFVTAIGIVFTLLIFGIFMPAAKVQLDEYRAASRFPSFGETPLGSEDSLLGRLLPVGFFVGRRAPIAMLAIITIATLGAGFVATDVQTEFDDEDFLPYEEMPWYLAYEPGVIDPGEYQATEIINFLRDNFETGEQDEVTIFIEGPIEASHSLETAHRAGTDPPDSFIQEDGQAVSESVVDVMHMYAGEDPEFAQLLAHNDMSGNGVPDRNLATIFDALFASPYGDMAEEYVTEDRTAMRIVYQVESDAAQEDVAVHAREVADDYRMDAIATGELLVMDAVTDLLFQSAIVSLSLALIVTAIFLVFVYWLIERRPSLGLVNLFPIIVTVTFLAATMVVLAIPINAITATILSITIGIGIAYSVHITHRFIDEYNIVGDAEISLLRTLRGTGGGVTGSMVTTASGVAVIGISVSPLLGQFAVLTSLSVVYSYLAALIVLPPTILIWERYARWRGIDQINRSAVADDAPLAEPSGDEASDPV